VTLLATIQIIGGLVLLVGGGELLVRGASKLAAAMKISPLVIGLTVVAFGTSAPEMGVSLQAAFAGKADVALGNVVGSNIFNVLFILGISALVAPLLVSSQLIRWDVPLMILASVVMWAVTLDGQVGRLDGAMMFGGLLVYTAWTVRQSRKESKQVLDEFAHGLPKPASGASGLLLQIGLIVVGLILLGFGSKWLVDGAVTVATRLGVSELIIGLTIVAAGTSLPELVTSVVASIRGERDIAVGNVVGSNLFNILGVLGLSSLVAPNGVAVSPDALHFDIPVMIAVAVVCFPIFFTGQIIARWEGALFLFYYLAYTIYLVLVPSNPELGIAFGGAMIWGVIPITVVLLLGSFYRDYRKSKR